MPPWPITWKILHPQVRYFFNRNFISCSSLSLLLLQALSFSKLLEALAEKRRDLNLCLGLLETIFLLLKQCTLLTLCHLDHLCPRRKKWNQRTVNLLHHPVNILKKLFHKIIPLTRDKFNPLNLCIHLGT